MPLGNLTSQFFANIYLNELDQYIKHHLKATYYIRYVDDFIILHNSKKQLETYQTKINHFLKTKLELELHPDKSKILILKNGITFLGFRIFPHHKLIRKKNFHRFERKLAGFKKDYDQGHLPREKIIESFEGWLAYSAHANTYKYRRKLIKRFNHLFPAEPEEHRKNEKRQENFQKKIKEADHEYTTQKTLKLFKKRLSIKEIATKRGLKETTIWNHLAQLIQYNQISVWKILPKWKIRKVLYNIHENQTLKQIKEQTDDKNITFDEITCILAHYKKEQEKKNLKTLLRWYRQTNCLRKCYLHKKQRDTCHAKFQQLHKKNPTLQMTKTEFLHFINNHITICILPQDQKTKHITWKEFIKTIKNQRESKKTQFRIN